MSLTYGPLKVVIWDPQGTQKTPNMRSCFDINLIDFGDDWDKQCTEINALFPELFMLFQQFCFSVVGEYEQVQALLCIRAQQSTAQHSTRMKAQHSTAQQNIAEQRAEWAHTTQSKAEQSRAEQSSAQHRTAEHSTAE